jgi:hypothetical protein
MVSKQGLYMVTWDWPVGESEPSREGAIMTFVTHLVKILPEYSISGNSILVIPHLPFCIYFESASLRVTSVCGMRMMAAGTCGWWGRIKELVNWGWENTPLHATRLIKIDMRQIFILTEEKS